MPIKTTTHRQGVIGPPVLRGLRAMVFNERLHNNGLQLTRAARCAPSPSAGGQSLRAALAAEAGCSADSWCNKQGRRR
jgi:hypothetical protein